MDRMVSTVTKGNVRLSYRQLLLGFFLLFAVPVARAALNPHMTWQSQESCLYLAREAQVTKISASKDRGDSCRVIIEGFIPRGKSLDDGLTVVKWDFTPEFALSMYGEEHDYLAKRFDPSTDFLLDPPYFIDQLVFLLIDFDPPEEGYQVYDVYIVEDYGGLPPSPPFTGFVVYQDTLHARYCDAGEHDGCGYFAVKSIGYPVVRYTTDPFWVILHFNYDPVTGWGPVLASDDGPNFPWYPYPPLEGIGVHQVFCDSYYRKYWIPGGEGQERSEWMAVDEDFHPELHRWNNLCINLGVRDLTDDGVDNLFVDDLTNMSLILVKPDHAHGDSLLPTKVANRGESFGVQGIVIDNSGDSAQAGQRCYGVQVIVTDPLGIPVYDVSWVDSFSVIRRDSFCVGVNYTIYPLYSVKEDTLGPAWVPDSTGDYTVTSIVWSWDCDQELSTDDSQRHDTLKVTVPVKGQEWTVMVYYSGDNNLDYGYHVLTQDMGEMEEVGSSDSVTILLFLDWYGDGNTHLYQVEEDTSFLIDDQASSWLDAEENMGDPQTLADFVVWATEASPAGYYLLVLRDHGHGIFHGECDDETDNDFLSLMELDSALAAIKEARGGQKLDIVAHDACLMGQVELHCQMAPYADIGIASEAEEPASGWHYTEPLMALRADPELTPRELAAAIVDSYVVYYDTTDFAEYYKRVTQAAVDLAALDTLLIPALNEFAYQCSLAMEEHSDSIEDKWIVTKRYGSGGATCLDLYHYASLIRPDSVVLPESLCNAAQTLMDIYPTVVFAESSGHCQPNSYGLTVWFPYCYRNLPTWWKNAYKSIRFPDYTLWVEFLRNHCEEKEIIVVHGYSIWEGLENLTVALEGIGMIYELWNLDQDGVPSGDLLGLYGMVIWLADRPLTFDEEVALRRYLDGGGRLWLIGQDLLSDSPRSFIADYLAGDFIPGLGAVPGFFNSDKIFPEEGCVRYGDGGYRVVLWAFPFEAIEDPIVRTELVEKTIDWLSD